MAVLSARAVAKRLVRIQKLSSLYHEEVDTMRADTVKTTVNALWRRYREYKRRTKTEPTFVEWLVKSKHFESTFWKSNGLATRRRWAIQYLNFLVGRSSRWLMTRRTCGCSMPSRTRSTPSTTTRTGSSASRRCRARRFLGTGSRKARRSASCDFSVRHPMKKETQPASLVGVTLTWVTGSDSSSVPILML